MYHVSTQGVDESMINVHYYYYLNSWRKLPSPGIHNRLMLQLCEENNNNQQRISHTLAPTSGTISPETSGTLPLSLPSKANSRHFSSQNVSVKQHCPSVCTVYSTCVSVCIFCIVTLEPLSTLCVSSFIYIYILFYFIADNISISMYSMCVILWLLAPSCRAGALHISFIIMAISTFSRDGSLSSNCLRRHTRVCLCASLA